MKRKIRSNGEGSIRKRNDGRWEARYSYGFDHKTGKHIQKSIYGKSESEVRKRLTEIESKLDRGECVESSKMLLERWLKIWLDYYNPNVKPYTKRAYEDRIKLHINPALGKMKLCDLTTTKIQRFINSLRAEHNGRPALSPKTICCIYDVLHKALKKAFAMKLLIDNPTDECVLPSKEKPKTYPISFKNLPDFISRAENDKFALIFMLDLMTGMREGEILGLTWDNIDFSTGMITIQHQLMSEKRSNGKYYLASLKNGKTRRVQVGESMMQRLQEHHAEQERIKKLLGSQWHEDIPDLVFQSDEGGHTSHTTVRKHFKRIVKSMGIPNTRFHDLRHTYAMISLRNGDDIKTVQDNLGHASSSFTLDVYGHSNDKMKAESASRMEHFLLDMSSKE